MARTDTASRVIAATPQQVYAALIASEALKVWLPPAGMTARFERFDPSPGESFRMTLTYADASASRGKTTPESDVVEGQFIELIPDVRVVQAVNFISDDPAYAGTMTMAWALTTVNGGTRVEITANNVPDGISAEDHAAGLASSLENLGNYFKR